MKIYTRRGDTGLTDCPYLKLRITKASAFIEMLGQIDEFTSYLGLCLCYINNSSSEETHVADEIHVTDVTDETHVTDVIHVADVTDVTTYILMCQQDLYKIMSYANYPEKYPLNIDTLVTNMETIIDTYTKVLPKLTNFILPGGGPSKCLAAAHLDVARTKCRQVERTLVKYTTHIGEHITMLIKYFNRLSDVLFTLARYIRYTHNNNDENSDHVCHLN